MASAPGAGAPVLWTPSPARIAGTRLTAFLHQLQTGILTEAGSSDPAGAAGLKPRPPLGMDYAALHRFSIAEPGEFWRAVWDFCGVIAPAPDGPVVVDVDRMPGAAFFPEARLNFAANLLRHRDDRVAILAYAEGASVRRLSWRQLYDEVSRAKSALEAAGVVAGDRVCAVMPNVPEAVIAALAAAAIGAVWSSCSPDFGVQGILDRFGQITPKVLVAAAGHTYAGKRHDGLRKLEEVCAKLRSLERVVVVPVAGESATALPAAAGAVEWRAWLAPHAASEIDFPLLPFRHPLYVLYSSGTTGVPKCIVHSAGGTLVQHLKEHQLHCDVRPDDRVFYFTTCGWMMWNWLVSVLASEAAIVLYDGSPFHPDGRRLFDIADDAGVTLFGTSARFIDAVSKAGLRPIDTHRLASMRTITSTGSPLSPESFDFVYDAIKADVHLASISGGTDIVSCFVGGNPNGPVRRGEIQVAGLGMDVAVFDEHGQPIREQPGELVCRRPFPSMPIGFWNDPDGARYRAAYFERFPGIWCHGDWAEVTASGGYIIHGRSDATLNPGGVRIGTAEIYLQVERLPEVIESLAVGQQWEGDERIVLFVRLRDGLTLDDDLASRLRQVIRANASPRHVPAKIIQVPDLPRTKSGKLVELAVRHVIHGREVANIEALANPEALEHFRGLNELQA